MWWIWLCCRVWYVSTHDTMCVCVCLPLLAMPTFINYMYSSIVIENSFVGKIVARLWLRRRAMMSIELFHTLLGT